MRVSLLLLLCVALASSDDLSLYMNPNGRLNGAQCSSEDPCGTLDALDHVLQKHYHDTGVPINLDVHLSPGLYKTGQLAKDHVALRARDSVSFTTVAGTDEAAEFPTLEQYFMVFIAPTVFINNVDWSLGAPRFNVSACASLKVYNSKFVRIAGLFSFLLTCTHH